jgi:adenylosuccinate lyase
LTQYLSAEAEVRYRIRVEIALLRGFARVGLVDNELVDDLERNSAGITAAHVAAREQTTRHDTAALVAELRDMAPKAVRPFVHLGATSNDIVDTANALRYREMIDEVLVPSVEVLAETCGRLAHRGELAVQSDLWRGHQERLTERRNEIKRIRERLHGKLSGAVGTYASFALLAIEPRRFERTTLARVGLTPTDISTQIVPGDGWADLAHGCLTTLGVVASLAEVVRSARPPEAGSKDDTDVVDDMSEILTVWRILVPRVMTTLADQISEHQRDLTNSASHRFLGEMLGGTAWAVTVLNRALVRR